MSYEWWLTHENEDRSPCEGCKRDCEGCEEAER